MCDSGKDNGRNGGHWWADGVDMKEWVTVIITTVYAIVALIFAVKVYCKDLTGIDNEFFWTLSWPVMVIVGFYFAEKVALNFSNAKLPRFSLLGKKAEDAESTVEDGRDSEYGESKGGY